MLRSVRMLWLSGMLGCSATGCGDLPLPRITAILPDRAPVGAEIDVVGEGFAGADGFVTVGGVQAAEDLWEARRVRITIPAVATGATVVVVTVEGRPSPPARFQVEPATP